MKILPIAGGLLNSDKSSQLLNTREQFSKQSKIPVVAKYKLGFFDDQTGHYFETTDLDIKKDKKQKKFNLFEDTYRDLFKERKVSLLLFIIEPEHWNNNSKFISYLKKKLERLSVVNYGYIWANDVGDKRFEIHTHIAIATSRLTSENIKTLIKRKHNYKFICCKNLQAFKNYLKNKELFAAKKNRSWGCSRTFKIPKS